MMRRIGTLISIIILRNDWGMSINLEGIEWNVIIWNLNESSQ
jgi:hypothetical protein